MTTAIVCGGRSYGVIPRYASADIIQFERNRAQRERDRLFQVLEHAPARLSVTRIVAGDQTGADYYAIEWAKAAGVDHKVYPADWTSLGNAAGPIRNKAMLEAEAPSCVIAFPGSNCTRNMCDLAEKAGVRVIKVDW